MAEQKKTNKKENEKCIHDGHRQRLVDLVWNVGLDNVSLIQAMEFILFYIFPRGDVNPLAHRLLDRFGDIPTVLEASIEDLQEVKGMGETSAKKLRNILDILFFYTEEKLNGKNTLKTIGDFYDYIEQLLRYQDHEELFMFGVTPMGEITKGRRFGKGTNLSVGFNIRDVILYLSTHKVNNVILVHNHPNGSCVASKQDVETYEKLKSVFAFTGGCLVDMTIVGIDGIYSLESKRKLRLFNVGLEYEQSISLLCSQQEKIEKPEE